MVSLGGSAPGLEDGILSTIIGPQQSDFWALTQLRFFMEHHFILGVGCQEIVLM